MTASHLCHAYLSGRTPGGGGGERGGACAGAWGVGRVRILSLFFFRSVCAAL